MEDGDHRCGRAWSNTSHYGVNRSNGDAVLKAQRSRESDTCVHTQEHAHTEEIERTSGCVPPAERKPSSLHAVQGGGPFLDVQPSC